MTDAVAETPILISDLKLVKNAIDACHTYLAASDVAKAQLAMSGVRYGPLTRTLETAQERINGILGDWLLEKEAARDLEVAEPEAQEELPANPLGRFQAPHQEGRVVASRRLAPEDFPEEEAGDDE